MTAADSLGTIVGEMVDFFFTRFASEEWLSEVELSLEAVLAVARGWAGFLLDDDGALLLEISVSVAVLHKGLGWESISGSRLAVV